MSTQAATSAAPVAPEPGGDEHLERVFVEERPWGRFQQFVANRPVTVKTITVDPGCRLSLQRHQHREELWHVLDGLADVHVDGVEQTLGAGAMLMVPRGAAHRLGNSGSVPVRVLEIAFGHFDEDDIERLEDDYSR
jgi:mannose-1-phosphate guanylyltransferase/mannose-6-phosphate isomerase